MSHLGSLTWDPGGTHTITDQLQFIIVPLSLAVVLLDTDEDSFTELDSSANIPVVGKYIYVLPDTGQTAYFNAFTPNHKTLVIPVVYAAINYECPYEGNDVSLW